MILKSVVCLICTNQKSLKYLILLFLLNGHIVLNVSTGCIWNSVHLSSVSEETLVSFVHIA